jgi:hypothetical protein
MPRIYPKWIAAFGVVWALAPLYAAGPNPRLEYRVKAAFVFNFAKFVEWPPGTGDSGPFVIGVFGSDPFGEILDTTVEGKTVRGRPLAVRRYISASEARGCDLLFVSAAETKHLPEILRNLAGRSVLVVGEGPELIRAGGAIGLIEEDDKVRFEINDTAAERAGLKISSQLLKLARRVTRD